jgi:hypothetical protein
MSKGVMISVICLAMTLLLSFTAAQASERGLAEGRAGWLLARADLAGGAADGPSTEWGSTGGPSGGGATLRRGLPMLMSLVMPGAGEAYLGHVRGYFMMALDIASWIGVKHYNDRGNDLRQEYYAYADAHWSEQRLADAYDPLVDGYAHTYFPEDWTELDDLSLWVSRQDDEREYYENLGKWDQFVFGWDDFTPPEAIPGYDPTGELIDLKQPGVSLHREVYRSMRQESNDQFTKRDRLLYLNLATRVFSIFQVAYLQGLLGGGGGSELKVAGHAVSLVAEPRGLTSTRLGVAIAY